MQQQQKETKFKKFNILSSEQIMKTPQKAQPTPNPKGNFQYQQENWINFTVQEDGKPIKLQTYRHQPDPSNPKNVTSVCIIFHGLNSHINNSAHIAQGIVEKTGAAVVGFDHRGFGKSEGIRGFVESEEQHISDSEKFIELIEKEYPGKKIFLSGQSMGGMTCFLLSIKFPNRFAGNILYCPAIKDQSSNAKVGKMIAKFVGFLFPKLKTIEQSHGLANKNPQISVDNTNDPYIYQGRVIPGTIRVLLNSMDKCYELYEKYSVPFLVIQGGIDKLVCPSLINELMERSPSTDKDALFYENAWHNIWMEDEITDIIAKVSEWIKKRI